MADDEITDSIDDAPDRDQSSGPSVTDELDEAAFGHDRRNDPTMGTTSDEDPGTAIAGETAYPDPPD